MWWLKIIQIYFLQCSWWEVWHKHCCAKIKVSAGLSSFRRLPCLFQLLGAAFVILWHMAPFLDVKASNVRLCPSCIISFWPPVLLHSSSPRNPWTTVGTPALSRITSLFYDELFSKFNSICKLNTLKVRTSLGGYYLAYQSSFIYK